MGNFLSSPSNAAEILFWLPLSVDLLLLVMTYGSFSYYGMDWYLDAVDKEKADSSSATAEAESKQKEDLTPAARERLDQVWELAMIAYSAYGCVFPWAAYTAFQHPNLRPSLSWAMTALMAFKYASVCFGLGGSGRTSAGHASDLQKSKSKSLLWFYFPTYGGYAIYKTFFEK